MAPEAKAVRIGHLYPSGGICDFELGDMAPGGINFITTRMPFRRTSLSDDLAFLKDLESHAALLTDAEVELIAVNCTAATMLAGADNVRRRVETATGIPAVTTIEAVSLALEALEAQRIALVTPYPEAVAKAEIAFLSRIGFSVTFTSNLPCETPVEQGTIQSKVWQELVQSIDPSSCDVILFSCAGIRISDRIDAIERSTRLPVVASNQALLWHCLEKLNVIERPKRFGLLLQKVVFDGGK